jgi:hypothetical protein
MLDVGRDCARPFALAPRAWLFYLSLDAKGREKAAANFEDKAFFESRVGEWTKHIERKGFAFDDHAIYAERMRFGAPVFDASGKIVGAIGSTATRRSLPKGGLSAFASALLDAAETLSGKLGYEKKQRTEIER